MTRHDTLSSPRILEQESRDVLCRACRTARHDTLVTTRATCTTCIQGVATVWTKVDMSTSLYPEVVPEIDANPEHVSWRNTCNLGFTPLPKWRCIMCNWQDSSGHCWEKCPTSLYAKNFPQF